MRFSGYHDSATLPVKRGQTIVIPAGTTVKTMHPSRASYVTKRKQTVKIDHVLSGSSISGLDALQDRKWRAGLERRGYDFTHLEELYKANSREFYDFRVPISNPSVRWPGAGGYWNEVDINDILEINGL